MFSIVTLSGDRVRAARSRCRLSQTDAALLLGVSRGTMSRWEHSGDGLEVTPLVAALVEGLERCAATELRHVLRTCDTLGSLRAAICLAVGQEVLDL